MKIHLKVRCGVITINSGGGSMAPYNTLHAPPKTPPTGGKSPGTPQDNHHGQHVSNPMSGHVWVSASAGSGKTKLLIDRLLIFLLKGYEPHRLLCLTFTRAAATEMSKRLYDRIKVWSMCPVESLHQELSTLLSRQPTNNEIDQSRGLFHTLLKEPRWLPIQTVHSFCQRVLRQFPLESGLAPYFNVLDERSAQEIVNQTIDGFLRHLHEKNSPFEKEFVYLRNLLPEKSLVKLFKEALSKRHRMHNILESYGGLQGYTKALSGFLGVSLCNNTPVYSSSHETALFQDFLKGFQEPVGSSWGVSGDISGDVFEDAAKGPSKGTTKPNIPDAIPRTLYKGTPTLWKSLQQLQAALEECLPQKSSVLAPWLQDPSQKTYGDYWGFFFTKEGVERQRLLPKAFYKKNPWVQQLVTHLIHHIQGYEAQKDTLFLFQGSRAFVGISQALDGFYTHLTRHKGVVDYDDLIERCYKLFNSKTCSAPWALYALDERIDHILIDEAQDTNPSQWKVIQAIVDDFFAFASPGSLPRTLFVVGDPKQSIYSFQGVDPLEFHRAKHLFRHKAHGYHQQWHELNLRVSFRSTPAVLAAVDAVFSLPHQRQGVSLQALSHEPCAAHEKLPGIVELWPFLELPLQTPLENPPTPENTIQTSATPGITSTNTPQNTPKNIQRDTPGGPSEAVCGSTKKNFSWKLPLSPPCQESPQKVLAKGIAHIIHGWLGGQHKLFIPKRPMTPGDILILVRRRGPFVEHLIQAFHEKKIPVADTDRLSFLSHMVVRDLMALGEFLLFPQDNLQLAIVLKGPLVNLDEKDLFTLSFNRGPLTLWERLRALSRQKKPPWTSTYQLLTNFLEKSQSQSPFHFYQWLLGPWGGRRLFAGRLGPGSHDAMDEFLNLTWAYHCDHVPTLQGFLSWLAKSEGDIKRDVDQKAHRIRIMTVHGAKGLQAPVVILPDTCSVPLPPRTCGWAHPVPPHDPQKPQDPNPQGSSFENTPFFLWSAQHLSHPAFHEAISNEQNKQEDEYRRLLYVAMTRAQERLYICGWKGRSFSENSWFSMVHRGLQCHPRTTSFSFQGPFSFWKGTGLRLALNECLVASTNASAPLLLQRRQRLPGFFHTPLRCKNFSPLPSAPSFSSFVVASPLEKKTKISLGREKALYLSFFFRFFPWFPSFNPLNAKAFLAQHHYPVDIHAYYLFLFEGLSSHSQGKVLSQPMEWDPTLSTSFSSGNLGVSAMVLDENKCCFVVLQEHMPYPCFLMKWRAIFEFFFQAYGKHAISCCLIRLDKPLFLFTTPQDFFHNPEAIFQKIFGFQPPIDG